MQLFGNQNKQVETMDGRLIRMDQLLEKEESTISRKKAIALILLYFLVFTVGFPILLSILLFFIGSSFSTQASLLQFQMITQTIYSLVVLGASVYFGKDLLKESYFALRRHKLFFLLVSIVLWVIMLYSVGVVSMLVSTITEEITSQNQKAVVSMVTSFPAFGVYYTVIFAPIVEELVFRGAIFRWLRTQKGFGFAMLVSCFLFAAMHVLISISSGNYLDLVNIFVYGVMAAYLCLAYEVTGSIYCPILIHFLNNLISIIVILMGLSA